ncbi:unnamed protein product [Brassica oleracea var. botrytis]|uniref:Neprosin activation peptide domain-containing protein n=2 Tax=Brassica TaxID=3705 RepID=A0A3P6EL39_BRAOL|nr:unnamed protein product [Brassica napus]CDY20574.1 BnaC07g12410D [Brassica napus]VDD36911.1 unnamed protein product [Brassica oleracea]
MTTPTYNLLCIGFMFLLSLAATYKMSAAPLRLHQNMSKLQLRLLISELKTFQVTLVWSPKQKQRIQSKKKGCKFRSFLHILDSYHEDSFSKGRFSGGHYKQKHDKDKIKGIVITPATTHEFGLSPGKDGFELGYSEEQPILRTEY